MKYENEITVKINCNYEELTQLLKEKGFEITNEVRLIDTYFIKQDIDVAHTSNEELMSNYLIVREPHNNHPQITYKYKEFNTDGSIKKQGKINCDVYDKEKAMELLTCIGYKKLFVIDNDIKFYEKDNIRFVAAYVNDEYLCMEYSGSDNQSIEEVIQYFEENYGDIPHDSSNYFINKAFIELDKVKENE